jgi:hypothetical protein
MCPPVERLACGWQDQKKTAAAAAAAAVRLQDNKKTAAAASGAEAVRLQGNKKTAAATAAATVRLQSLAMTVKQTVKYSRWVLRRMPVRQALWAQEAAAAAAAL